MAAAPQAAPGQSLPPPRSEVGVIGWMRENLFSSWYNSLLTVSASAIIVLALVYGLRWIIAGADWTVIGVLGGQMVIGQFNTESACPGQNCFWRPQVALMLVSAMLGMGWAMAGGGVARRLGIGVVAVITLFAFLPYSFERMGMDVRLLLAANIPALGIGWVVARYSNMTGRDIVIYGVTVFIITVILLRGIEGVPGMQRVSVPHWGGIMLNLLLAVVGIAISLPIGIALALGRRSNLPVVKLLCVVFIEVFRGVPLITLLFMSQVLVPLAFPEDLHTSSLLRAGIVITLFSSAYMAENIRGGLQALHPGQAEAARALGTARVADHAAHLVAPGHPQRHSRHRGAVHRSVQGHQPGLHHRDAGRGGDQPCLHPGQCRIPVQRQRGVHLPRPGVLGVHLHHVLRQPEGRGTPGRGPAIADRPSRGEVGV